MGELLLKSYAWRWFGRIELFRLLCAKAPFSAASRPLDARDRDVICVRARWNLGYQMDKCQADFSPGL